MRLLVALVLPFVAFFSIGRPIQGIVSLVLQLTLVGWVPAAVWAVETLYPGETKDLAAGPIPK